MEAKIPDRFCANYLYQTLNFFFHPSAFSSNYSCEKNFSLINDKFVVDELNTYHYSFKKLHIKINFYIFHFHRKEIQLIQLHCSNNTAFDKWICLYKLFVNWQKDRYFNKRDNEFGLLRRKMNGFH